MEKWPQKSDRLPLTERKTKNETPLEKRVDLGVTNPFPSAPFPLLETLLQNDSILYVFLRRSLNPRNQLWSMTSFEAFYVLYATSDCMLME